ncbi:alkaline phosphatase-like [Culicoides brevitarsis]|uniref:alkaline phosphatase-like n=1 Tax=Culicoides brevitarsis TaxID=469753 RepID=UPI00307C5FA4
MGGLTQKFLLISFLIVHGKGFPQQLIERTEYAHEPHVRSLYQPEKYFTKVSSGNDVTTVRPSSTHPMDNPSWKAPLGPMEERKEQFWIDNGQNYLKKRLALNLNKKVAKNVIIFIGDGMSLATQMATRAYLGNENIYLSFEKFPFTGLSKTYAPNYQVPDSANTASAILAGSKNNYGTVGVTGEVRLQDCKAAQNEKNHLKTIMKWAQEQGRSTGIVTTTRLTHATPAASYAISPDREFENDGNTPEGCTDIAKQLILGETGKNFKVQLGGGSREFYPSEEMIHGWNGSRKDRINLVDEWKKLHSDRAKVAMNRDELLKINANNTDFLFGLFSNSHMAYHMEADPSVEPTLEEMTAKAIEILQKNEKGFVLLVEGGLIDQAHHRNFGQMALNETQEFAKAIQYAKDATDDEETLIVVTADHSHTFTVGGYPERGNDILDVGDFSRLDGLPFLTLAYANGMSYFDHFENGKRKNPDDMPVHDPRFTYPSNVPYEDETHGGEDVAVYANGPWSHLFVGNYEQSYIFHAMMYASCLGGSNYEKAPACNGGHKIAGMSAATLLIAVLMITGLKQLLLDD